MRFSGWEVMSMLVTVSYTHLDVYKRQGSRYSADNGGVARVGIKYIDVADEDAFILNKIPN